MSQVELLSLASPDSVGGISMSCLIFVTDKPCAGKSEKRMYCIWRSITQSSHTQFMKLGGSLLGALRLSMHVGEIPDGDSAAGLYPLCTLRTWHSHIQAPEHEL